ncbi:cytochrome P450 2K1-like [Sphaeramia orbicularis]|uniref:Cytochrome P450 2K1-like n=1 Tax=Sphaeramia orbicularis TaxID=375764 RepID=A0A673AU57_9TELE|nr:cytochrome P450 2K1-like [Sphaeramia orbicularis]
MGLFGPLVSILSSSPTTLLGAVAVLLFLYLLFSNFISQQGRTEPPGPRRLPLIGNLLQLDLKRPYETLCELSKEYGSVFTIYMGINKVVVLAGYETVKEALVNHGEEFGNRDISPILYETNLGYGIAFANGESWKEMRTFAITVLREFVMETSAAEDKITEECSHVIQILEKHQGKPFETADPINNATFNIIASIVYGSRFEYDDPTFTSMVERNDESVRLAGSKLIQIYNMFPKLTGWISDRTQMLNNAETNVKEVRSVVKTLQETLNPDKCRGFVDHFLVRMQKDEDAQVKDTYFTEMNLIVSVSSLFRAGVRATAGSLQWALLFMARYPQIQNQVYEELNRVVGSRQVRVNDRESLPYTNAVIHEIQRLADVTPLAIPHQTSQDVTFHDYFIKKGTTVFALLTSVLYDETQWESPLTFNPGHFLDEEGKFIKRDAFLPLSAGWRMCIGESLAKMELFLFFTSLLQRFQFTPPPGVKEDELDLTSVPGFTRVPLRHKLCAIIRQ